MGLSYEALKALLGEAIPGSPLMFGVLIALATVCLWLSVAPSGGRRKEGDRLDEYVTRVEQATDQALEPFGQRVIMPLIRRVLRLLGRAMPNRAMAATQRRLIHAGEPGKLGVLDFYGLQLLSAIVMSALALLLVRKMGLSLNSIMFGAVLVVLGLYLPNFWLSNKVDSRSKAVLRALPNALDMLTIGVEAGLAFESAMLRVAERWDNPLTREFRHVVLEMRVGTSRDQALMHMAERTNVPDLRTFVAILVQSNQLGVSIADVLHSQAALMRDKRRQRAEAIARQATVKMAFPLVFFIFPALFVVILGPALPSLLDLFRNMGGG